MPNPELTLAKPEWMQRSLLDVGNTITILQRGVIPKSLHGSFLRTMALRLLRVVYGSNRASVEALQVHVAELEAEDARIATEIAARVESGMSYIEALDDICRMAEEK
jgi:hypothetical protein